MNWLKSLLSGARKIALPAATAVGVATPMVADFEGLRTSAYLDIVGVPTICFGETKGVKMGDTATVEECEAMLADRLNDFEQKIVNCAPEYKGLPVDTQAAILSLTYNIGQGALCRSTLVRKMKMGDLSAMCAEFTRWNRAGGRVVNGLVRRRAIEREACERGLRAL